MVFVVSSRTGQASRSDQKRYFPAPIYQEDEREDFEGGWNWSGGVGTG